MEKRMGQEGCGRPPAAAVIDMNCGIFQEDGRYRKLNGQVSTSLLTCEKCEIRAPIVVRLLIFSPKARGYAYKTGCGDHARGVGNAKRRASSPVRPRAIVPQNRRKIASLEGSRTRNRAPTPPIAPSRDGCPWVCGASGRRMRIRTTNKQSLWPPAAKRSLAAALPRMSYAVLGEGERRDGLPRELPCAGIAWHGSR